MSRYTVLFFTLFIYHVANGDSTPLLQKQGDSRIDSLSTCIAAISKIELACIPTVAVDTSNLKETTKSMLLENLASSLMQNNIPIAIASKKIIENNISIMNEDTETYHLYGIFVTGFETCDDAISFDFENVRGEEKYIILIFNPFTDNCAKNLKEIGISVAKYDITFMFLDLNTDMIEIYTFIPIIAHGACQEIVNEPTYINTCKNLTMQKGEVFPPKTDLNFNKCSLKVGMAVGYPFCQIEDVQALKTYDRIPEPEGSDLRILKIIANIFNASLDVYYINRDREVSLQNEFLNFLLNGSLDVCAGGLYRVYGELVAYSGIYARQSIVWIYYVERSERSWANLVIKLNGSYIFVLFYVIYIVTWYIFCLFDGDEASLTNMLLYGWGALIGANSLRTPRSLKQKILNIGYMIMTIYFSVYISIHMYSFLTISEAPLMYNTHEEVMESGRVPYLIYKMKYFVLDKKFEAFANSSGDCYSFGDCVEKMLLNNGLTIVLQGDFYNYQQMTAVNGEAKLLKANDNILTVYHEMLIRKGSPIAKKFHQIVNNLFEAGITQQFFSEAIGLLSMGKAISANTNMMTNSYSCQSGCSITLKQFVGIFYTWMFGCALSIAVFILELLWKHGNVSTV